MGLKKVFVVDGGFATQLSQHVGEAVDGDPLWSARFNYTKPKAILDTHYDFLQGEAGRKDKFFSFSPILNL